MVYYPREMRGVRLKNDRLFQILYLLLQRGDTTAPELAAKLEVSVRTIYRDLDALGAAGIPVCTLAGKGGGISLMAGYTVSKAMLTDEEQNQILFAMQGLRATDRPDDPLLQKLSGLFKKPSHNWIEIDFSRWGYGRIDRKCFELLKTAILDGYVLRIVYCNAAGEIGERDIKPFRLVFKSKGWYVLAFCLKAEDYRLFKVSRMIEVTVTEQRFADVYDDAPPVEPPMDPAAGGIQAELLFTQTIAYRVYDEFEPAGIVKQPDGKLLVHTAFPSVEEVISYLLTFGTALTVISPPMLRARLSQQAALIAAHHKT